MSAQPPLTQLESRPSILLGVVIGCLPVQLAVIAAVGVMQCNVGIMSIYSCSNADTAQVIHVGVISLIGWVLELLTGLIFLFSRQLRRVGGGLLIMAGLFLPLATLPPYITHALPSWFECAALADRCTKQGRAPASCPTPSPIRVASC